MRICTMAYVKGSREAVLQILNRAFRSLSTKEVAVDDGDTVGSINRKIKQANTVLEGYRAAFTLVDFLDDRNRMECPYEDYVLSYIDEPEPDGSENYGVDLVGIQQEESGFTLQIGFDKEEVQGGYTRDDWQDWCERMVRLYGCRIVTTEECYRDMKPVQYACLYEPDALGIVNLTVIDM